MNTGIVKFFNEQKGYGFITDEESQDDVFVHATGLIDEIKNGDKVEYEVMEDRRGPKAVNVKVLSGEPAAE